LTQRELAEAVALRTLGYGRGFSATYLSKIENRLGRPSALVIAQLAHVLGVEADELLALAGRISNDVTKLLTESSGARALFRYAGEMNLSENDWQALLEALERKK